MEDEIVRTMHENGHFGVKETYEKLITEFHIINANEKIENIIKNYVKCILVNQKSKEGNLIPINKEFLPLSTYHIDHWGPMMIASKKYKYIFTVTDAFSKCV